MVEKDENVIWVEDESPDEMQEALSVKIIKAGTGHGDSRPPV